MTITLTTDNLVADAGLVRAILDAASGITTGTTPPGAVDYFPADPAIAPFPSPENSQIMVIDGVVSGRPYLKDQAGAVHQIRPDGAGVPQYFKNSLLMALWPGERVAQCLVRQGEVYLQISGGIWKHVDPNGTMYNRDLPPPWATAGESPPLPLLPAMPARSVIAPGSSGTTIRVGPSRVVKTLSDAIGVAGAGDTIELDPGTYTDTPPAWTVPLLIDLGGATFDATGRSATLALGKGLFVPRADSIIQHGTITGVAMDQAAGQMTSAIRPDTGCGYLTLRDMVLSANQCGIGEGMIGNCAIELTDCDISNNGLKNNVGSLTHNLYVGGDCVKLTLTSVVSTNPTEGHAIKYRGPWLIVNGGTFASAAGKAFDIPDGATVPFQINNATIRKGAADPDHGILTLGVESTVNGMAGGIISGGTIAAACPAPAILGPRGTVTLSGVTISDNPIVARGGLTVL